MAPCSPVRSTAQGDRTGSAGRAARRRPRLGVPVVRHRGRGRGPVLPGLRRARWRNRDRGASAHEAAGSPNSSSRRCVRASWSNALCASHRPNGIANVYPDLVPERREFGKPDRGRLQGGPNVFADVPHPQREDLARVDLAEDEDARLSPDPKQGFRRREAGRVVAPADRRVGLPAAVPLVVPDHHDPGRVRIPERTRIPGFDRLVPVRPREEDEKPTVVESGVRVDPELLEGRQVTDARPGSAFRGCRRPR